MKTSFDQRLYFWQITSSFSKSTYFVEIPKCSYFYTSWLASCCQYPMYNVHLFSDVSGTDQVKTSCQPSRAMIMPMILGFIPSRNIGYDLFTLIRTPNLPILHSLISWKNCSGLLLCFSWGAKMECRLLISPCSLLTSLHRLESSERSDCWEEGLLLLRVLSNFLAEMLLWSWALAISSLRMIWRQFS